MKPVRTLPPKAVARITIDASTDAAYYGTDLADQMTFAGPVVLNLPVATADVITPKPGRAVHLAATGPAALRDRAIRARRGERADGRESSQFDGG